MYNYFKLLTKIEPILFYFLNPLLMILRLVLKKEDNLIVLIKIKQILIVKMKNHLSQEQLEGI